MVRAMFARTRLLFLVLVALAIPLAAFSMGCSGSSGGGSKHPSVKPGDMPEGGDWSGVYYSPFYGYLHLIKEGETVNGAWRTASGEKWGEMSGPIEGDVFKFEWTEHTIGLVGPNSTKSGKGYFRYTIPKRGEAHEIVGERGYGSDSAGEPWKGVKQMNMTPNIKSVKPDELEGRGQGGGWDTEENKPPPPKKEEGGEGGE